MPLWRNAVQMPWTWTAGAAPPPVTGQSPRATRYAKRYRVNWIVRLWPLLLWLPRLGLI